jgi:hypothetical protein
MPSAHAAPRSRFLLGPLRDLGLIVAVPAWLTPLVFAIGLFSTDKAINNWVTALGALGHHLPGLLRAYGDRELFRRFRARFLVAPVACFGLAYGASARGLHGVVLIAFLWGVWHGMMQSYGFARIYGAKEGATGRADSLTDLALVATWFGAALVSSPLRVAAIADAVAACGVPLPAPSALAAARTALLAATALATVAWLVAAGVAWRRGRPPGLLRTANLAIAIGFWWFANVRVRHLLLATPLFELFHDVQYLAIVWLFNRRNALRAPFASLFRPRALSVAAYLAAVLAYGALGRIGDLSYSSDGLTAFFTASALLHFYYDGFLWKVREAGTQAPIGVAPSAATGPRRPWLAPPVRHAALWVGMAASVAALAFAERRGGPSALERLPRVAALAPDNTIIGFSAAEAAWRRGDVDAALAGFRHVLAVDDTVDAARNNLTLSLLDLADRAAAAHDGARLAPLLAELRALRPRLTGDMAAAADAFLDTM